MHIRMQTVMSVLVMGQLLQQAGKADPERQDTFMCTAGAIVMVLQDDMQHSIITRLVTLRGG
jgi:hypothetical protein